MFSCEFCEISKNTYFTEHLWAKKALHFSPPPLKKAIHLHKRIKMNHMLLLSVCFRPPYELCAQTIYINIVSDGVLFVFIP